jgi:membrane associated rhomboid family serine protease
MVKILEMEEGLSFARLGIFPRKLSGLIGIITSPFIHGDLQHLINNSLPLFILTAAVFYFYEELAYRVFFLIYLMVGLWVWFGARPAYHIGASGLIYGLGAFLFFSGIIRRYPKLMAISLLVAFLYGSMVWGVLPIQKEISWESHLLGAFAGIILSFYFRKIGPQRPIPEFLLEEDEDSEEDDVESEEFNHLKIKDN